MSIVEAIVFAFRVYGIVIVISFLCAFIIWAVVHTLSAVAKQEPTMKPVAVPERVPAPAVAAATPSLAPVAAPAPAPVVANGVPPEHVAAIAAAVYALAGGAAVLRIEDGRHRTAWVTEGRLAHHSSHSPIRNR